MRFHLPQGMGEMESFISWGKGKVSETDTEQARSYLGKLGNNKEPVIEKEEKQGNY